MAQPKEPLFLNNKSDGKTVSVPVGTIVEVHLEGTRDNTGWERGSIKGDALVHLNLQPKQPSRPGLQSLPIGSEFLPDAKAADRAIGTYVFIFEAAKEGRAELMMQYITPGGPGVTARLRSALIATFKVTIDVTAAKANAQALHQQHRKALPTSHRSRMGICLPCGDDDGIPLRREHLH